MAQLESAILNLAVNARDAMPGGGILTIEACNATLDESTVDPDRDAAPGNYVVLSLSDTGTGMSPAVIAKVFEPFFTTKGSNGTGLGLSMVHGFVKQSGGHTRIYSEVGKGTTVRIFLPRAPGNETQAETVPPPCTTASGEESILIVEDNERLRNLVARQLKYLGYQTITAGDAAEALDIIRGSGSIDLLFTDVILPGTTDGWALAEAACKSRGDIKVLFTSGFTAAAAAASLAREFGSNILTKPYRADELADHVRAAIDGVA
jgi:CheY-like chemotaxis protein